MVAQFASRVHALSLRWPISVTSWGRTPQRNEEVGGSPRSLHLSWLGLDVVLEGKQSDNRFKWFADDAKTLGLEAINEGDHWHIEPAWSTIFGWGVKT